MFIVKKHICFETDKATELTLPWFYNLQVESCELRVAILRK